MDSIRSAFSGSNTNEQSKQQSSGGFMDQMNSSLGGGKRGEQNEDMLDKGV